MRKSRDRRTSRRLEPAAAPVTVELDVFSGRPNPRWRLTGEPVVRLRELHDRLVEQAPSPPEVPGLGYRGFRYVLDGIAWRAYDGCVSSDLGTFLDPGEHIEHFLADQLPPAHEYLKTVIARPRR